MSKVVLFLCLLSLSHSLPPKGYFLVYKLVEDDSVGIIDYTFTHAYLFNVTLEGTVTELWNYTSKPPNVAFHGSNFAIDLESGLVYLGMMTQYLALDLKTGTTKISIGLSGANMQYFWNYDYYPNEKAIRGVCTGTGGWHWCDVKLEEDNVVHVSRHYSMPYTELGPMKSTFDHDRSTKTIWYAVLNHVVGVHYPTGEVVFKSGPADPMCIGHDAKLNKTFTILRQSLALAQVHPDPTPEEKLLDLPTDLRTYFGGCVYDPISHTMFIMATNPSVHGNSSMPDTLLNVDVVNLKFERTSLPGFNEHWNSSSPITGAYFIHT